MGVNNLWQLLNMCKRQIKIQDLKNCTVAIDVSIWIINSMNASLSLKRVHKSKLFFLTNFIKKILVLLENEILPIFVFDGATPALKRKEVLRRINEQMDNKRHAKIMAKSFLNGLLDKKFDKKDFKNLIDDENEMATIDEIFEFIFLKKDQHNDIELMKLQQGMLEEFLNLLLEKEFIDKKDFKHLRKCDTMQQVVQELNSRITWKLKNKRTSDIDHLDSTLKRFEINQLLRQINNKLKQKIEQYQGEQILAQNQLNNADQYQIQRVGKFQNDNDRKFVMLQKKGANDHSQNFLIPDFSQQKKIRKQNKQERMKEILQRFNNVRQQQYNQQVGIMSQPQQANKQEEDISVKNFTQVDSSVKQDNQITGFFEQSKLESFFDQEEDGASIDQTDKAEFDPMKFFEEEFKDKMQELKENKQFEKPKKVERVAETAQKFKRNFRPTSLNYKKKNAKRRFKKLKIPKKPKITQTQQVPQQNQEEPRRIQNFQSQQPKKLSLNEKEKLSMNSEDQLEFLQEAEHNPLWDVQNYNFQINPRHLEQDENKKRRLGRIQMDSFFVKNETNEIIKGILDLLGLPYIRAKEEAEAQCAYMQQKGIADFIITEDSDIFLFGAESVIKNFTGFFLGKTSLEIVQLQDLEKYLSVNRDELILMAHLLGCDYCEGVRGIGVVNAFETVQNFRNLTQLKNLFQKWGQQRDDLIDKNFYKINKYSKKQQEFLEEHKNYKKHWIFNENFGNKKITDAFVNPKIKKINDKKKFIKPGVFQREEFMKFLEENFSFEQRQLDIMMKKFTDSLQKMQKQTINQYFNSKKLFTTPLDIKTKSQRMQKFIKTNNQIQYIYEFLFSGINGLEFLSLLFSFNEFFLEFLLS